MNAITLLSQDVLTAAPGLIGWTLTANTGGAVTAGIIVETEAYRAEGDPAAHAFRGRTARNAPMWERPGTMYVYLNYGLHELFNLVTGPVGQAQAVLIRALEPTVGLEIMAERRHTTNLLNLTSGPAKLTQALAIDRTLTGKPLGTLITLTPPLSPVQGDIITTTRIGINKARDLPWRFYLAGNMHVSRP